MVAARMLAVWLAEHRLRRCNTPGRRSLAAPRHSLQAWAPPQSLQATPTAGKRQRRKSRQTGATSTNRRPLAALSACGPLS
eukprot:2186252-Prymnesium_polylepis.1